MDELDDDSPICEACDKRHSWDHTHPTLDGCYLCDSCWSDWRDDVKKCTHSWTCSDADGEPAQYCERCGVIVLDTDMEDFLAGKVQL